MESRTRNPLVAPYLLGDLSGIRISLVITKTCGDILLAIYQRSTWLTPEHTAKHSLDEVGMTDEMDGYVNFTAVIAPALASTCTFVALTLWAPQ